MIPLLVQNVAVQLLQLLHARLSPLRFLLNLSLLTLLVRVLNSCSPTLHAFVQGFNLNHNHLHAALSIIKACTLNLLFFLLINLIILAIFFLSRRGSSSQAAAAADDDHEDIADKPSDTLAKYIPSAPPIDLDNSYKPSNYELSISSAANSSKLAILPSAPPIGLDNSYIPSNYNIALGTSSSLYSNIITSNQLELVPVSESQKTMVGPSAMSNQLQLVHTSQGKLGKKSIESCRLDRDEMKLCGYSTREKLPCNSLARGASSPSNSMLQNEEEIVPIVGTITREKASQKSLIRYKSDTSHVANKSTYKYCGRSVSCTHYYEYTRDEACSTARLYTASSIDSLNQEQAHKHFSDFTSRKWATMRKES